MSFINPLLNTGGSVILLTYFGDRPYTLGVLYYGMALGAMFVSIIVWFLSYNAVMTSDKFIYLFGRVVPSVSLVLTMVLRLVPNYQRKIRQIAGARKCIGKGADSDNKREKAEDGLTILSALTAWAFEGGIVMADSMRCRGYGCGKRTNFSIYTFGTRNRLLLLFMAALLAITFMAAAKGGMQTSYTPPRFADCRWYLDDHRLHRIHDLFSCPNGIKHIGGNHMAHFESEDLIKAISV